MVLSGLYGTLAQCYFALRSYDAQLALADSALATRQENLRLQKRRFSAGSIGELDLHQAGGELAATEVTREQARQSIATTESAVALLAGRMPRAIASPQIQRGASIADLYARIVVPSGLPADLLNQRPDILAAEQALRAANADIGQARAQYTARAPGGHGGFVSGGRGWLDRENVGAMANSKGASKECIPLRCLL